MDARAAHGVNLKLVKLGGAVAALELGRRARAAGLRLMAGAMVETRVGLLAMAHVVAALGGVDWIDLDTAFLLADDPFQGGWSVSGPRIELTGEPGLGVDTRSRRESIISDPLPPSAGGGFGRGAVGRLARKVRPLPNPPPRTGEGIGNDRTHGAGATRGSAN